MVSLLAVVLVAGLLVATGTALAQMKSSTVTGVVVSVDTKGKALTFKTDDGVNVTLPAEGGAIKALDDVKAGERVELTCRDDDTGAHQAITAIAKVKPKGETKP
jgi:Cu/Ag efflux protein CusF